MLGLGMGLGRAPVAGYLPGPSLLIRPPDAGWQDKLDFSRATAGTYTDSAGVLQTAASGVPRLDYRFTGSLWVPAGLLIEAQGTNRYLSSQDLTTASWLRAGVNPLVGAVIENDQNAVHYMQGSASNGNGITLNAGETQTYSFIVSERAGSAKRYFAILVPSGGAMPSNTGAGFDLATGQVLLQSATASGAGARPLGNGQWLCWLSITAVSSGNANPQIRINNIPTSLNSVYQGDGVSGINVSDMQAEAGLFPTSRIRTIAAQATRVSDVFTKPLGVEFNPDAQTALLRLNLSDPAVGTFYSWVTAVNDRIELFSNSGQLRVRTIVASATTTSHVLGPAMVAGTEYRVAFGFDRVAGKIRLVVNGVAYADQTPSAFPNVTERKLGSRGGNTASVMQGWLQPYLPHPTNPLLDATEFPRLLSAAEMQAYTA